MTTPLIDDAVRQLVDGARQVASGARALPTGDRALIVAVLLGAAVAIGIPLVRKQPKVIHVIDA